MFGRFVQVWYAAVDQAFFSLSVGFGVIIMLASYNDFRHNVYRDATIISFADTFTSLLAGFTIFAISESPIISITQLLVEACIKLLSRRKV